jgi:hypothetical protein
VTTETKTITRAEPSVGDKPPLKRHLIEKAPDPDRPGKFLPDKLSDLTLCGERWDRLLDIVGLSGSTCEECQNEAMRRARK